MTEQTELTVDLEKLRAEYEAWFIGKFGYPPMPIHSRVLDFCWHGYQAGRKASESEVAELRQQLAEWNEKAKNWMASPEAEKQLDGYRAMGAKCAELEAETSELRQQVTLLRDALGVAHNNAVQCGLMAPKNSMTHLSIALCKMEEAIDAALAATEEQQ